MPSARCGTFPCNAAGHCCPNWSRFPKISNAVCRVKSAKKLYEYHAPRQTVCVFGFASKYATSMCYVCCCAALLHECRHSTHTYSRWRTSVASLRPRDAVLLQRIHWLFPVHRVAPVGRTSLRPFEPGIQQRRELCAPQSQGHSQRQSRSLRSVVSSAHCRARVVVTSRFPSVPWRRWHTLYDITAG